MLKIGFPPPSFKTRLGDDYDEIFDPFRKKWVKLTPEEWVRQNFLSFLVTMAKYPPGLIAVEKEIRVGELKRRYDIVMFDRDGIPWMLVECKSMDMPLTEKVLSQALAYKSQMPCSYLIITNGNYTYGWKINDNGITALEQFPAFSS